jgi:hypothetical protein
MLRPWAVLAWSSLAALPLAIANAPPADQSATPPAAAPNSSPPPAAAAAHEAASAAASGLSNPDLVDKHLRAQGYKPEMRHGEKYYCRVTDTLGSRVSPVKACGTAEALMRKEQEAREFLQATQRTSTMCPSNSPTACR